MSASPILVTVVGVYCVIAGIVRLVLERRAMRRAGRPMRRLQGPDGAVRAVFGIVLRVLVVTRVWR